jgi:hypothetical protein
MIKDDGSMATISIDLRRLPYNGWTGDFVQTLTGIYELRGKITIGDKNSVNEARTYNWIKLTPNIYTGNPSFAGIIFVKELNAIVFVNMSYQSEDIFLHNIHIATKYIVNNLDVLTYINACNQILFSSRTDDSNPRHFLKTWQNTLNTPL